MDINSDIYDSTACVFSPLFHHLIVYSFYKKQTKILKRTNYLHYRLKRKNESLFCIIWSLFSNEVKWKSHSVVSNSLWSHGLYSPWNSPGQNTGVGSLSLLQGIFPIQGSNQVSCIAGGFFTSWAAREALSLETHTWNYTLYGKEFVKQLYSNNKIK